jgi:hypothetical protein
MIKHETWVHSISEEQVLLGVFLGDVGLALAGRNS